MESKDIFIKVYNNIDNELKNEWLNLEKKGELHVFQKYNFIKNFIENKKGNFVFVTMSLGKKVFCILPLHIHEKYGFKILQWIGNKEFDYCGAITNDFYEYIPNEKVFKKLWEKILSHFNRLDLIFLNNQLEKIRYDQNPFVFYLKNKIFSKVYLINLFSSYEKYINEISNKKFLNEFHRTKNKLTKENSVQFQNLDINNGILELEDIIRQKINFLENRKIKHQLNRNLLEFFSKVKTDDPNSLKIGILRINNEVIAANIGFVFNQSFYYYMPVIFSEKFSKFSPGKILLSCLIEWSINNKLEIFDFGLGDENYKKYWCNDTVNLSRYLNFKSFKGFFAYLLIRIYIFFKY